MKFTSLTTFFFFKLVVYLIFVGSWKIVEIPFLLLDMRTPITILALLWSWYSMMRFPRWCYENRRHLWGDNTLVNSVCISTTFLLKMTSNSHYKDEFNGHRRWIGLFKDGFYKHRLWNWSNLINFHLFPLLNRTTLAPVWVILCSLSLFDCRGSRRRWSLKVIF